MPEMPATDIHLLERYRAFGSPEDIRKKQQDLETDNQKQRDEIRDLKLKLPKEGEAVVPKSDADLLPKYKELGKVEDIKAKLNKGEEAQAELSNRDRKDAASRFAKAVGLADESVETMVAIPALKDATFEVKKGKIKDKKTQAEVDGEIGYITLAGNGQKPMTYEEALETVPALKGLRMSDGNQQQRTGTTFVKQGGQSTSKPGNVYDRIRESRKTETKEELPTAKPITERLGMK